MSEMQIGDQTGAPIANPGCVMKPLTWSEFIPELEKQRTADLQWPYLKLLRAYLKQWAFDDSGAIYVPPEQRGRENIADSYLRLFRYRNGMQSAELQ